MRDDSIVKLYFLRNENAIKETQDKYGNYLKKVAYTILNQRESAQECENDTYLKTWNSIPPTKPSVFKAFLAKITRNLAIDKYRKDFSKKHGEGQVTVCLDELSECIGERNPVEDRTILKHALESFLKGIPYKNRNVFMMRYFFLMSIKEIAEVNGMSENAVKMMLHRLREKLRDHLYKEGIGV